MLTTMPEIELREGRRAELLSWAASVGGTRRWIQAW
jgi:hypothetical protein